MIYDADGFVYQFENLPCTKLDPLVAQNEFQLEKNIWGGFLTDGEGS